MMRKYLLALAIALMGVLTFTSCDDNSPEPIDVPGNTDSPYAFVAPYTRMNAPMPEVRAYMETAGMWKECMEEDEPVWENVIKYTNADNSIIVEYEFDNDKLDNIYIVYKQGIDKFEQAKREWTQQLGIKWHDVEQPDLPYSWGFLKDGRTLAYIRGVQNDGDGGNQWISIRVFAALYGDDSNTNFFYFEPCLQWGASMDEVISYMQEDGMWEMQESEDPESELTFRSLQHDVTLTYLFYEGLIEAKLTYNNSQSSYPYMLSYWEEAYLLEWEHETTEEGTISMAVTPDNTTMIFGEMNDELGENAFTLTFSQNNWVIW